MEEKGCYGPRRLKSLRQQAKITQQELSKRTKIKHQCIISDLECGRRELTWGWAREIAGVYNMSPDELMKEVHGSYGREESQEKVTREKRV